MDQPVKFTIRIACRSLLRPVALLMMRCGVTWKEFSNLSKSVFVEAASSEFGIKGRPTNISRVSILTGISRKEVKRQRELISANGSDGSGKTTDATRVLSGWYQDSDFLDSSGEPLPLPLQGAFPRFADLFARYGGDTSEQSLIKELRKAKSIETNEAGCLVAKTRYYMPTQISDEWISMAGQFLHDLGVNVNHNLEAGKSDTSRFLGFAVDHQVRPDAAVEFRAFMEEQGQLFLQEIDDWLVQHKVEAQPDENTKTIRLGVGLFTIQNQTK